MTQPFSIAEVKTLMLQLLRLVDSWRRGGGGGVVVVGGVGWGGGWGRLRTGLGAQGALSAGGQLAAALE